MIRESIEFIPAERWVILDHGVSGNPNVSKKKRSTSSRYNAYPAGKDDTNEYLEVEHHGKFVSSHSIMSDALDELEKLWIVERVMEEVPDPDEIDRESIKRIEAMQAKKHIAVAEKAVAVLNKHQLPDGTLHPGVRRALDIVLRSEFGLKIVDAEEDPELKL
jgi:hypothetical protein